MNYIETIICTVIGATATAVVIKAAMAVLSLIQQMQPAIESVERIAPMMEQIVSQLPA